MSKQATGLKPAIAVVVCCSFFYFLGLWRTPLINTNKKDLKRLIPCPKIYRVNSTRQPAPIPSKNVVSLDFDLHHQTEDTPSRMPNQSRTPSLSRISSHEDDGEPMPMFEFCNMMHSEHTPCEDPSRAMNFSTKNMYFRERHCPPEDEKMKCLIPHPLGYKPPFPWPKSREYAWYANVPHKRLTVAKADQNWIKFQKDRFFFPGGGTSFPSGAKKYIQNMAKLVPLDDGSIRTALDTGCGVASWGAYLLNYNVLTMSIAPIDVHEAQVQFALERGVPAMVGLLGTRRLPYPARAFDMAHCSRCLIPWTDHDGLYLIEIDRLLRPGGYWILSGPPINWKKHHIGWNRTVESLRNEQQRIEDFARHLCWKKVAERGDIAVWQKPTNHIHCIKNRKVLQYPSICREGNEDDAWYKNMETCITPLPSVNDIKDVAGMALEKWPKRLSVIPPRIARQTLPGVTNELFNEDTKGWTKRIDYYQRYIGKLTGGKFRNIMDMNARLGGFAAALVDYPVWVMNVVPVQTGNDTLGVIYERGLIGTYMDWCEAFSTYPRTYDLVHAHNIFSMYQDRCDIVDILLEMDRVIRPTGAVVIRDHVDVLVKVKKITDRMRWQGQLQHSERGSFDEEKILFFNSTRSSSDGVSKVR